MNGPVEEKSANSQMSMSPAFCHLFASLEDCDVGVVVATIPEMIKSDGSV